MAPWADSEDLFSTNMEQLRQIAEIIKLIEQTPEDELDTLRDRLRDEPFRQALTSIFSVGGARPKAMIELDGQQWIAKFPKADDVWDEPLVEHATMTLAEKAGIGVASTKTLKIGSISVLLVKRFDRDEIGRPAPFHFRLHGPRRGRGGRLGELSGPCPGRQASGRRNRR